jgi:hypothetical protein
LPGVKGVWKVGEEHADDLSAKDERAYNLLSKADFNAEIIDYQTERGLI